MPFGYGRSGGGSGGGGGRGRGDKKPGDLLGDQIYDVAVDDGKHPNVVDLVLPPMLARYRVSGWEVACLGHGGLLG